MNNASSLAQVGSGSCIRMVLLVVLGAARWSSACAQVVPAQAQDPQVLADTTTVTYYLNFSVLDDEERATAITALTEFLYATGRTRAYTVQRGDNFYELVHKQLHVLTRWAPGSVLPMRARIKSFNRLGETEAIQRDDVLALPSPLPYINRPLDPSKVAFHDLSGESRLCEVTDDLRLQELSDSIPWNVPEQPGLIAYQLRLGEARQLDNILLTRVGRRTRERCAALSPDSNSICPIELLEDHPAPHDAVFSPPAACVRSNELAGIPDTCFRDLVVLDVFDGPQTCAHGDKVLNVVRGVLRSYGLEGVWGHVQPVNVDVARNPDSSKLVDTFFKSPLFSSADFAPLKTDAARYVQQYPVGRAMTVVAGSYGTPELLLKAHIWKSVLTAPAPDVVTSSFVVPVAYHRVFPPMSAGSSTNLITAGLNRTGSLLEQEIENGPGGLRVFREPLVSYHENRSGRTAIVGNYLTQGSFAGMSSRDGMHMTLGTGTGRAGTCIQSHDSGTSFATPEVATKLFMAKAYWRWKRHTISNEGARARLFACTDLDVGMVARFASAGTVNMCKLLCLTQAFVETLDGAVIEVELVANAASVIDYEGGGSRLTSSSPPILGLAHLDGRWFIYDKSEQRWKEDAAASPNLNLRLNGADTPVNKQYFTTHFKQFVLLPR